MTVFFVLKISLALLKPLLIIAYNNKLGINGKMLSDRF